MTDADRVDQILEHLQQVYTEQGVWLRNAKSSLGYWAAAQLLARGDIVAVERALPHLDQVAR